MLYFGIVCSAKLSILFMYNRIFAISQSFRRQVYALSTLVVMFGIACTLANIFDCQPLQWSLPTWVMATSPAEYCMNFNIFWLVSGVIEVIFDITIISLPVNMVRRMQMDLKKRIGLLAVFLLGAL